jgi:hypothetical protein
MTTYLLDTNACKWAVFDEDDARAAGTVRAELAAAGNLSAPMMSFSLAKREDAA